MKFRILRLSVMPVLLTFFLPIYSFSMPEQRIALIIGNGGYRSASLVNSVNDAHDLAIALQHLGFEVIHQKNAILRDMENAIRDFGKRLKNGGVGLFYYAGHAVQLNEKNYLIPIDSQIQQATDAKYESVDLGLVLDAMGNAGNRVNIVILDACRNNPFPKSTRSFNRGLARIDAPKGTLIAFSTAPGDVALDGSGPNSPYTVSLLNHINTPDLPIEQVFKNVRKDVDALTNGKQIPWENTSLIGDFYFKTSTADRGITVTKRPVAKPLRPAAEIRPLAMAPKPPAVSAVRYFTNSLGMKFAYIYPGTFQMGSPIDESGRHDDELQHHVTLTKGFYLQTTEVTQGQWQQIMGENPSRFKDCGDNCPVEQVSWDDAQEFIRRLNQLLGTQKYRLPIEAEWDFACRAQTPTSFPFGNCLTTKQANYNGNKPPEGCEKGKYMKRTLPVASLAANPWGLYDMQGNVWEWCQDFYDKYPSEPVSDPAGAVAGTSRVIRGGSWHDPADQCRAANRQKHPPGYRSSRVGFRLVRTPFDNDR